MLLDAPILDRIDASVDTFVARIEAQLAVSVAKANPTEIEWRRLHRIIMRSAPNVQRAFTRAVAAVQNGTRIAAVRRALESDGVDAAVDIIPWDHLGEPIVRSQLLRQLRDVFDQAGEISATIIPKVEPFPFEVVSDRAARAMAAHGGDLIVEISESIRDGVRASLNDMLDRGYSTQQAATRIKPQIGLHERFATAVTNRRERLAEQGFRGQALERQVDSYANSLRQHRALTIARHEPRIAANMGQREAWEQAIEQGFVDRGSFFKRWVTVESEHEPDDPCPGLDGQVQPVDEDFVHPETGETFDMPPNPHIGCTCGVEAVVR